MVETYENADNSSYCVKSAYAERVKMQNSMQPKYGDQSPENMGEQTKSDTKQTGP